MIGTNGNFCEILTAAPSDNIFIENVLFETHRSLVKELRTRFKVGSFWQRPKVGRLVGRKYIVSLKNCFHSEYSPSEEYCIFTRRSFGYTNFLVTLCRAFELIVHLRAQPVNYENIFLVHPPLWQSGCRQTVRNVWRTVNHDQLHSTVFADRKSFVVVFIVLLFSSVIWRRKGCDRSFRFV